MTYYAVLIGNSQFSPTAELRALTSPSQDVAGLAAELKAEGRGLFSDITTLVNKSSGEIKRSLIKVLKATGKDDLVLLYYSGHGLPNNKHNDLYLATADTERYFLEATALSFAELYRWISQSYCKRVVIILDCCFSGMAGHAFKGDIADQLANINDKVSSTVLITAASNDQVAQQHSESGYSLFTKYLIDGLRGDADSNGKGVIGVSELFHYVRERVTRDNPSQHPKRFLKDETGELIIAKSGRDIRKERASKIAAYLYDLATDKRITHSILNASLRILANLPQDMSVTEAAQDALLTQLFEDHDVMEFILKFDRLDNVAQANQMTKPADPRSEQSVAAKLEPITIIEKVESPSKFEESLATGEQATTLPLENDSFVAGLAGFTSEFCGVGGHAHVPDHLGVEGEANRLAELIALRETKLPLAIGLFGNWGSGKSHFMNLMDRRMKYLAHQENTDSSGTWCREIVPIYFNAWHYLDTNLWASLVTEIFEGLFRHISPEKDSPVVRAEKIKNLMAELQKAGGAVAHAEKDIEQAKAAKARAELEVQLAEIKANKAAKQREVLEVGINAALDSLTQLIPHDEMQAGWQKAVKVFHLDEVDESYSKLTTQLAEFHTLRGQLRAVWQAILSPEGRATRIAWFIGAILVAPLIAWIVMWMLAQNWNVEIQQIEKVMGEVVVLLAGFSSWCGVQLQRGKKLIGQLEEIEEKARKKRTNKKGSDELKAERAELEKCIQAEKSANEQLNAAQERVRNLQEAHPEQRFLRFIEQRAQAQDYSAHLGLISLIRKDFHELSRLFTEKESSEPTQDKSLSASIDRIVLFVDDLDRCQPEKVVDVLQAVHLLLAYPLFAVVVGVDQRCLKQSLETEFKGLVANEKTKKNEGYQATSLDYLEKIFHIPFHLPTMGETGFSTLIENLTEHNVQISSEIPELEPVLSKSETPLPASETPLPQLETPPPAHEDSGNTPIEGNLAPAPKLSKPKKLSSTPLARWERDALKDYHSLIHSPRGAKRLLNTYRLVRAGIPENEWQDFAGDDSHNGDFRVAMLLLAAAAGHPFVVREWFKILRNHDWTTTELTDVPLDDTSKQGWDDFRTAFSLTFEKITLKPSTELFTKWLDRVERFTF